jgi:hypothetical protein
MEPRKGSFHLTRKEGIMETQEQKCVRPAAVPEWVTETPVDTKYNLIMFDTDQ